MLSKSKLLLLIVVFSFGNGCSIILDNMNPIETNQKIAVLQIINIISNQFHYLEEKGSFVDFNTMPTPTGSHYSYELKVSNSEFQIWASPRRYGITGIESYYFSSQTRQIHGADKKGEKAGPNDPVVEEIKDERFEKLNEVSKGN